MRQTDLPTAWSLLQVEDAQFAGNDGYPDVLGKTYSWDSTVANNEGPMVGDLAIVRSGTTILGSGYIEQLNRGVDVKQRRRCPSCATTDLKERRTSTPKYRCSKCHHEFEEPTIELIDVRTFAAQFDSTWLSDGQDVAAFEAIIESRARMHSIRELPLADAENLLQRPVHEDLTRGAVPEPKVPSNSVATSSKDSGAHNRDTERNQLTGDQGERLVFQDQKQLLLKAGRTDLSEKVEWVARTVGPSAGYDIKSFNVDGAERYIEVKTTTGSAHTRFFITASEVRFGGEHPESYEIHRLHDLKGSMANYFVLAGDPATTCQLRPESFSAKPTAM